MIYYTSYKCLLGRLSVQVHWDTKAQFLHRLHIMLSANLYAIVKQVQRSVFLSHLSFKDVLLPSRKFSAARSPGYSLRERERRTYNTFQIPHRVRLLSFHFLLFHFLVSQCLSSLFFQLEWNPSLLYGPGFISIAVSSLGLSQKTPDSYCEAPRNNVRRSHDTGDSILATLRSFHFSYFFSLLLFLRDLSCTTEQRKGRGRCVGI